MFRSILSFFIFMLMCPVLSAQSSKTYSLKSPDGSVELTLQAGAELKWSVRHSGQQVIAPSTASLILQNNEILGTNIKVVSVKTESINQQFEAIHYRRNVVKDICNQITLNCRGDYGVIFRIYNDAVAYRFFTRRKGELIIVNEEANFNFTGDHKAFIPIQWDYRGGEIFNSSFEALYREIHLSQFPEDSLAFLPLLIDAGNNKKVEILEADLEDYPGMYIDLKQDGNGLFGVFAPFPLETKIGGYNRLNLIPVKRAGYIAKTSGNRNFPWRVAIISANDIDLLNCDVVQKLASPCRISETGWIKPGQVSWDWWNDWNISHVDFRAGINNETYKYYIDFASANKIPYIILDEGWTKDDDLSQTIAPINLEELVDYGREKGVGLILWASWRNVMAQKEKVFPLFSKMGIKGLKIDFIDRDDQLAVRSTYEIVELAAEYHLMIDFHGVYKPTGLQRTYPNVVGYEGVKGMENVKWADEDVPRYDVTIPFIRNVAGPMDYTSGAMRNSNRANFRAIGSMPMSKGTRAHQLAMYVIFEVPLQMLSDNPTAYMKEQECTDFITSIPVTFDETVPLAGKVAEYVAIARKKGSNWFVGAMTNWNPKELIIDLSFLEPGVYRAVIFKDGINADRDATDYKKEEIIVRPGDKLNIKMLNGGGWAARIVPLSENPAPVDANATKETKSLFRNLYALSENHILFGHHNATEYGHGWSGDNDRSDVKSVCGSHPAVIGVDISGFSGRPEPEIQKAKENLRKTVIDTYMRGGITTISWHFINPVSKGGFYWVDTVSKPAVKYIIPGGEAHNEYKEILKNIAEWAHSIKGPAQESIPVIFRPYHEFDGDWFWWGKSHCTREEFISLWRFTFTYLRDSLGVHNFLYAFSPDNKFSSEQEFLERYPGNDYVDLVGTDNYGDMGRNGVYRLDEAAKKLKIISDYAVRNGKLAAFTETGLESITNPLWWTECLLKTLTMHKMRLCYVMVWRNDISSPTHYYAPFPGHNSVPDFLKFFNDPYTLFEKDLRQVYH